jgi:large subunit ribosomal protein L25
MDPVSLAVKDRTAFGKKLRALRRSGLTPLHVYGLGDESLSLQVETDTLIRTLAKVGKTTPFMLGVEGVEHYVIIRDVQLHPVTDRILHVDLLRVSQTARMHAAVPVQLEGEAPAAREAGTMLMQELFALEVESLPQELPSLITIDVSILISVDSVIRAGEIELPSNVNLVTSPEASVVRISQQRGASRPDAVGGTEAGGERGDSVVPPAGSEKL